MSKSRKPLRGWQCPACKRCFAPFIPECPYCVMNVQKLVRALMDKQGTLHVIGLRGSERADAGDGEIKLRIEGEGTETEE